MMWVAIDSMKNIDAIVKERKNYEKKKNAKDKRCDNCNYGSVQYVIC